MHSRCSTNQRLLPDRKTKCRSCLMPLFTPILRLNLQVSPDLQQDLLRRRDRLLLLQHGLDLLR